MNLRKLILLFIGLVVIISSCNNDDDDMFEPIPDRPRDEVYEEDIVEIEDYLRTHFFNYEDFDLDNPESPANDGVEIVFDTIAGVNSDKVSLMDQYDPNNEGLLKLKIVEDRDVEYKLYYLEVRKGGGNTINFCDTASLTYEGSSMTGDVFDSAVNPTNFSLITIPNVENGIITGLQQALLEFQTSTGFNTNPDGTIQYENNGIGAVFIPSGLAYFSQPIGAVPAYSPLIFKFGLLERTLRDHDIDRVWSYLEDLNGNGNAYDDDTDGDFTPNFIDNDDDGDGYLTRDELGYNTYVVNTNIGETEPDLAEKEYEMSRTEENGIITIETFVMLDRNDDDTPDFLDKNTIPE